MLDTGVQSQALSQGPVVLAYSVGLKVAGYIPYTDVERTKRNILRGDIVEIEDASQNITSICSTRINHAVLAVGYDLRVPDEVGSLTPICLTMYSSASSQGWEMGVSNIVDVFHAVKHELLLELANRLAPALLFLGKVQWEAMENFRFGTMPKHCNECNQLGLIKVQERPNGVLQYLRLNSCISEQ